MWGRWALRNNLTKTFISSKPSALGRLFRDTRIEITDIIEFPLDPDDRVSKIFPNFLFVFKCLER